MSTEAKTWTVERRVTPEDVVEEIDHLIDGPVHDYIYDTLVILQKNDVNETNIGAIIKAFAKKYFLEVPKNRNEFHEDIREELIENQQTEMPLS